MEKTAHKWNDLMWKIEDRLKWDLNCQCLLYPERKWKKKKNRMDLAFSGWQFHTVYWKYCRVQINFSKLYCEKLYGKNLLVLVSPEGPLWLSLMGRTFCNFAYFRLLEKAISNRIKLLKVTSATQLFFVIKQCLMCY